MLQDCYLCEWNFLFFGITQNCHSKPTNAQGQCQKTTRYTMTRLYFCCRIACRCVTRRNVQWPSKSLPRQYSQLIQKMDCKTSDIWMMVLKENFFLESTEYSCKLTHTADKITEKQTFQISGEVATLEKNFDKNTVEVSTRRYNKYRTSKLQRNHPR